jgi:hypothetical protein
MAERTIATQRIDDQYVDLDGTLVAADLLWESLLQLVANRRFKLRFQLSTQKGPSFSGASGFCVG